MKNKNTFGVMENEERQVLRDLSVHFRLRELYRKVDNHIEHRIELLALDWNGSYRIAGIWRPKTVEQSNMWVKELKEKFNIE